MKRLRRWSMTNPRLRFIRRHYTGRAFGDRHASMGLDETSCVQAYMLYYF